MAVKAKPVKANIKFRLAPGKATPAPPVGSMLGAQGVNMMDFVNAFNEQTRELSDSMLNVRVKIFEDRTFTFTYTGDTMASLIKKAAGLEKGSGVPNKTKVGQLTKAQVTELADKKIKDMNATSPEAAQKIVAGQARSMGIEDEVAAEMEEVRAENPEVELPDEAAGSAKATEEDLTAGKAAEVTDAEETDGNADDPAEKGSEPKTAKAGRRSAKAVREADAEEQRLEAKEHRGEVEAEAEVAIKARRRQQPNPLHQHGKKYRQAAELIDKEKGYTLAEGLDLAKLTAVTKFDSAVELHINLGVDPRQADQMVRGSVTLPHGTGKTVRVAVYAEGELAKAATEAGADRVGSADLLADIEAGKLDFDLLIAPPAGMAALGKVAKILGPKGLMPNPKSGTVAADVAAAVRDIKGGKVEFRIDKQAIIHQVIGRASFTAEQLNDNATVLVKAILQAKPSSAKGTYVKAIAITTSMGPGIKLDAPATISAISTGKK